MTQSKTNVIAVTIAIYIATFVSSVEGTILSTALPTIVGDLHGVSLMNWVFSIYLLVTAMVTPIYGKLTDLIGRKPVVQVGLAIFTFGSLMSGLSNSMLELVFWRAIQGVGAGALPTATVTIIADLYPYEKRPQILGLNNLVWGIATLSAPLIGGIVVNTLSWHWVFFVNIPLRILIMVLFQIFLHESKQHSKVNVDLWGSFWLMISVLFLMLSFQFLSYKDIDWLSVAAFIVVSLVTFWQFIRHERYAENPVVSLKLFKNRPFMVQNSVAALISGYLMAITVYIPIWVQGVLGTPVSYAGFAVTPHSIFWIIGSFVTSYLITRWTPRKILRFSLLIVLFAGILLAFIPMMTEFGWFLVITAISGFGFGITIVTTTVESQHLVSKNNVGVATSFNTLAKTLGQTLMVSIFGIMLNVGIQHGISTHQGTNLTMVNQLINPKTAAGLSADDLPVLRQVLYGGLHWIYLLGLMVIILAILINTFGYKNKPQP
ncbi:MFS transporter [Companilactobacillus jidongensis]|uniref:MFS transporter n=1 Tax=Companilactobacillus jidongensis TaxID=2486006 RepID=UPI000F7A784F|nr:MFS transporter [Companilactobacillus jidongensis]